MQLPSLSFVWSKITEGRVWDRRNWNFILRACEQAACMRGCRVGILQPAQVHMAASFFLRAAFSTVPHWSARGQELKGEWNSLTNKIHTPCWALCRRFVVKYLVCYLCLQREFWKTICSNPSLRRFVRSFLACFVARIIGLSVLSELVLWFYWAPFEVKWSKIVQLLNCSAVSAVTLDTVGMSTLE